ncbi:GM19137 [Drosophila sechellia]|uniref:GM19137 n=1 Tax=Drosophila sechellia TaxID=7238 RepID=B4I9D9_DROSE|nr:GM19137 [Drosophila sechellia]
MVREENAAQATEARRGFLSWDVSDCHVDLEEELNTITQNAPEGEEARHGLSFDGTADGDGDAEALSLKDMLSATPALNARHLAIVRMGKSWQRQRAFHLLSQSHFVCVPSSKLLKQNSEVAPPQSGPKPNNDGATTAISIPRVPPGQPNWSRMVAGALESRLRTQNALNALASLGALYSPKIPIGALDEKRNPDKGPMVPKLSTFLRGCLQTTDTSSPPPLGHT